jgi:hypothetical protein
MDSVGATGSDREGAVFLVGGMVVVVKDRGGGSMVTGGVLEQLEVRGGGGSSHQHARR